MCVCGRDSSICMKSSIEKAKTLVIYQHYFCRPDLLPVTMEAPYVALRSEHSKKPSHWWQYQATKGPGYSSLNRKTPGHFNSPVPCQILTVFPSHFSILPCPLPVLLQSQSCSKEMENMQTDLKKSKIPEQSETRGTRKKDSVSLALNVEAAGAKDGENWAGGWMAMTSVFCLFVCLHQDHLTAKNKLAGEGKVWGTQYLLLCL